MFTPVLNAVLAAFAAGVSFWAAPRLGSWLRLATFAQGILAAGYAISYTWLAFNLAERAAWSAFMSWWAFTVWPLVWILPPLATVYWARRHGKELVEQAERMAQEAQQ